MRKVIMFLSMAVFFSFVYIISAYHLAGGLSGFAYPPHPAFESEYFVIVVLFLIAGLISSWGFFHRCKCACNGKCDCKK